MTTGLGYEVNVNCAIQGYFTASSGNFLQTFRDYLSVPSSWAKNPRSSKTEPIDLTFMGPPIVNIFQYISNKMELYTVCLYLETTLHVSGGTSTHHQESIQLYLQHVVFVTTLLLPAAIVPTHPR